MTTGFAVTSEPSVEPVSLADMKTFLKVSHDAENALITSMIVRARRLVETRTKRRLITQTIAETFPNFPGGTKIELLGSPLQSVTSVAYVDVDGNSQTFSSSNYSVVTDRVRGLIRLKSSASWPSVEGQNDTAVTVTYVAGYGDAATDVPAELIGLVEMLVAMYYENRGDSARDINMEQFMKAVEQLESTEAIVELR